MTLALTIIADDSFLILMVAAAVLFGVGTIMAAAARSWPMALACAGLCLASCAWLVS